jgi:hypothetical protein
VIFKERKMGDIYSIMDYVTSPRGRPAISTTEETVATTILKTATYRRLNKCRPTSQPSSSVWSCRGLPASPIESYRTGAGSHAGSFIGLDPTLITFWGRECGHILAPESYRAEANISAGSFIGLGPAPTALRVTTF